MDMDASGPTILPPPVATAYSITNISVISSDADKKIVSIIFHDNAIWFRRMEWTGRFSCYYGRYIEFYNISGRQDS